MPKRCSIGGCSNSNYDGVTLHAWPKNETLGHKWDLFARIKRADWVNGIPGVSIICGSHFLPSDYDNYGQWKAGMTSRLRLNNDAVPTVNVSSGATDTGVQQQRQCVIGGCSTSNYVGVTLHFWPNNEKLAHKWDLFVRIKRADWVQGIPGESNICGLHFLPTDYHQWKAGLSLRLRLKIDAVPTVHVSSGAPDTGVQQQSQTTAVTEVNGAVSSRDHHSCTSDPESSAAAITEMIGFSDEKDSSDEGSSEVDQGEHNSDSDWDPLELSTNLLKKSKSMPKRCSIGGCSNSNYDGVTLHAWPKNETLGHKWDLFAQIKRADWVNGIPGVSIICGSHFLPSDYDNYGQWKAGMISRLRLNNEAVPTVNVSSGATDTGVQQQRQCVIGGCSTSNYGGVTLHFWPNNKKLAHKWDLFVRIKRADWVQGIPGESNICGLHFLPTDYHQWKAGLSPRLRLRLKIDAVPTVHVSSGAPDTGVQQQSQTPAVTEVNGAVSSRDHHSCTSDPESSVAAITEMIGFSDEKDSSDEGSSEVDQGDHNSDSDWDPLEHHSIDGKLSDSDWDPWELSTNLLKKSKSMPKQCSIGGCSNSNYDGVTLHAWPKNETRGHKWDLFARIKRADWVNGIPGVSIICGSHFLPSDYDNYGQWKAGMTSRLRLNNDAVPTVNVSSGATDTGVQQQRQCVIGGCSTSNYVGVTLHFWPNNEKLAHKWDLFVRIKRADWVQGIPGESNICGLHFLPIDYHQWNAGLSLRLRLKIDAVPTVHVSSGAPDTGVQQQSQTTAVTEVNGAVSSRDHHSCTSDPESSAAAITEMIGFSDEKDSSDEGSSEVDQGEHNLDSDWDPLEHHSIDGKLSDSESDADEEHEKDCRKHNSDSDWDPLEHEWSSIHEKDCRKLCPDCGTFFKNQKAHICENKKPYSCILCGKRFLSELNLKAHNKIHEDGYKHVCKYCYSTFRTRAKKLVHEQNHPPAEKPYQCPKCPEVFAKMLECSNHLVSHRRPKRHTCLICNMEFPKKDKLDRHVAVHTKAKPFVCKVCQRSFTQSTHLKSHMRVHTGEKPYECQHCDKSFNHNVSLKSHIQRYHGQVPDPGERIQMEKTSTNVSEVEEDETNEMESSSVDDEGAQTDEAESSGVDADKTEQSNTLCKPDDDKLEKVQKRSTGRPRGRPKKNTVITLDDPNQLKRLLWVRNEKGQGNSDSTDEEQDHDDSDPIFEPSGRKRRKIKKVNRQT